MSQAEKKSLIKNRNHADSQPAGAPEKSGKHRNILFGNTVPSGGGGGVDEFFILSCSNQTFVRLPSQPV